MENFDLVARPVATASAPATDGKLVFARQMAENFDKADFGLKPVACENVGAKIFDHGEDVARVGALRDAAAVEGHLHGAGAIDVDGDRRGVALIRADGLVRIALEGRDGRRRA